jgi:hypothetical protein
MREAAGSGAASGADWRAEFQEAVLRFIVREGSPIDERGSRYRGSHHPDWLGIGAHLNTPGYIRAGAWTARQREIVAEWTAGLGEGTGCELDFEQMSWSNSSWTTWDSFDESMGRATGVDATVFCRCGRIAGVVWRWEGGLARLIRGVTGTGRGEGGGAG